MAQDQIHRLADLSVAFISLVEAPANQRSLLVKSASADQQVFERQVVIIKTVATYKVNQCQGSLLDLPPWDHSYRAHPPRTMGTRPP